MKNITNRQKGIAYLLVIIMLLQSCAIYHKQPSTIEEAAAERKTQIKITTKNGELHKLRWIEEENGYIYSIKKTKRIYVKKSKLSTNPVLNYRFIETKDEGEYIRGITMTGKDTATVRIPIDQIEEIKLINYSKTYGIPWLVICVISLTAGIIYGAFNIRVPIAP